MPADATRTGYREAIRRFQRNAKLYLIYSALSSVNSSIFLVAFAFYLEELYNPTGNPAATVRFLGVPMLVPAFIGVAFGAQAIAHGANSLPSGILGDRYGRKRSFIAASLLAVFAGVAVLLTTDPMFLVGLAVVVGIGESFHGVVGAPFLMENSRPEERIHLFTLSGVLSTVSAVVGAFLGGILPGLFASIAGGPNPDLTALRWTLFTALPFGLIELIPLAFMRESFMPFAARLRDLLAMKHVAHKGNVARLFGISAAYAAGLGLYFPLLNLHFEHEFEVHADQFGPIVAINEIGIALAILTVPLLVARLGKVRTITVTRLASVPFLLGLALAGDVYLATLLFVLRGALSSLAFPVTGAFAMEVVDAPERATTAGFTHAAFDVFYGGTVVIGGVLLAAGGFWLTFVFAGVLYVLHALLWYGFFRGHPVDLASRTPAVAGASE